MEKEILDRLERIEEKIDELISILLDEEDEDFEEDDF